MNPLTEPDNLAYIFSIKTSSHTNTLKDDDDVSNEINLNRVIQFENCFSNAKPGLRRMFPNQNQAKQSIFDQQLRVISKHTEFL